MLLLIHIDIFHYINEKLCEPDEVKDVSLIYIFFTLPHKKYVIKVEQCMSNLLFKILS